jgi:hypothetical protein
LSIFNHIKKISMVEYICLNCGKTFLGKKSAHRKYCCKQCSDEHSKGKPNEKNAVDKIEVICAYCGKIEYVTPSRAKTYQCCSTTCSALFRKKTELNCTCPICGNQFYAKPSRIKKVKTQICCSKECSNKLRETTYLGENNHQYGLTGDKNASFKGKETISNLGYVLEYCPGHPKPCDKSVQGSRVRQHRLVIERNHDKFDPKYFENVNGWIVLKDEYDVHHINEIKTDNRLENLQILTRSEHTTYHNTKAHERSEKYKAIIGVLKQGELLETPEVDNQQPSLSSNTLEGSETSSRVLSEDSNATTSALLQQIINIVGEDIVRPADITNETAELKNKESLG